MCCLQFGRGARLVQVIGPAVQLRDEDGAVRGDIYQLNGVERGQARGAVPRKSLLCEVIGGPIKQSAKLTGNPIKGRVKCGTSHSTELR